MTNALLILGELNDRDIDWIVTQGKREVLQAGTVLIEEDQPLDALYIVLSGTLNVCVAALGNQVVGKIGGGEILGEMSFVDGRLPSATVQAVEECCVLSIPRLLLAQKLEEDVLFSLRFYRAITKFLSSRLRATVNHFGHDDNVTFLASKPSNNIPENEPDHRLDWIMQRLGG
ncbi:cyclic nucleotide-binding domain-containing protein [Planktothrix mougeotii]|uniref:Cyclic nucleotide-binding domain-containing protein n=1 Tax=Planktothrix mougeotii LEGE 06226 TaxID=1828728 RepID=A0ABR9U753_9CYAN|nr:cyclic nucleotide-binding domain-containing protein [Planktothrix mougeotii]MBE9141949.1 cyclic nucleotide-binding domain-containing protein [Planktothrix mougeotii LEGE 06226]